MNKCPSCGHENRAGEILCANCGTNLITGEKSHSTRKFDDNSKQIAKESYGDQVINAVSSGDMFPQDGTLRLEIVGSPLPINVKFSRPTLTLGRRDPATGVLPDIDLAPFAGYRMGVSRRHSQIRRTDEGHLELFDLGSSNGTFLNGQRLAPHTPYRINNYDRIALGQIVFQVIYRLPEGDPLESTISGGAGSAKTDSDDKASVSPQSSSESSEMLSQASDSSREKDIAAQSPLSDSEPVSGKLTEPAFEVIKDTETSHSQRQNSVDKPPADTGVSTAENTQKKDDSSTEAVVRNTSAETRTEQVNSEDENTSAAQTEDKDKQEG